MHLFLQSLPFSLLMGEVTRNTCQTGVSTDLATLTEHYFLCKDTTVHIYYEEKTLLDIGKYFFKVKILKCKGTHGKDFSITLTISETMLRDTVLFYNHSTT